MDCRSDLTRHAPVSEFCRERVLLALTLTLATGFPGSVFAAGDGTFEEIFEPSGIAPLPDGRLLVVDDEPRNALHLVTPIVDDGCVTLGEQTRLDPPDGLLTNLKLGKFDDLEGVAHDTTGRMYVVTSQDRSSFKSSDRRKLARFVVDGSRMSEVAMKTEVRGELLAALPELERAMKSGAKHDRELDVEAIALDRQRGRLVLGLRTPRVDDRAALVVIDDPDDWLENDSAPSATLLRVDLDGGGVRAMAYDDDTDTFLIVSRDETEKKAPYLLWSLPATDGDVLQAPSLLLDDEKLLKDVEGVTLVEHGVLFVRDDGNRKKGERGSWFFKSRRALGLSEANR